MEEKIKTLENQVVDLQCQIVEMQNTLAEYKAEIENCNNRISDLRNDAIIRKDLHPKEGRFENYNMQTINVWKKYVGTPLMKRFEKVYCEYRKLTKTDNPFIQPWNLIYATMNKSFGFHQYDAANHFRDRYGETLNTYNMVASDHLYQMYFVQSANKLISVYSQKNDEIKSHQNDGSSVDYNIDDQFIQAFDDEITDNTEIDKAIEIVSRYFDDISEGKKNTWTNILKTMYTPEQWKAELEDLHLSDVSINTKKEAIEISKRNRNKFLQTCADLVLDQKAAMFCNIVV